VATLIEEAATNAAVLHAEVQLQVEVEAGINSGVEVLLMIGEIITIE